VGISCPHHLSPEYRPVGKYSPWVEMALSYGALPRVSHPVHLTSCAVFFLMTWTFASQGLLPAHAGHLQLIPSCKKCAIAPPLYANILIKNIGWVSAKATILATASMERAGNSMLYLPLTAWYIW
jgi:hypothetical protein